MGNLRRAYLNMEDKEGGGINCQAVFEGGFDVNSNSHQHLNMLLKYLDKLARREEDPEPLVTGDPLPTDLSDERKASEFIAGMLADNKTSPEKMEYPKLRSV